MVPNNELDEAEVGYLQYCCDRVDTFLSKNPVKIDIEISVTILKYDGTELNHGSLDVLFTFKNFTGILIDFKFGWIPVAPAEENLQGKNYAVGCFQKYPKLNRIGVEFLQPKLGYTTSTLFSRADLPKLLNELIFVIDRADYVLTNPADAQKFMKPGPYCDYCSLSGSCRGAHQPSRPGGRLDERHRRLLSPSAGWSWTRPRRWLSHATGSTTMEKGVEDVKALAFHRWLESSRRVPRPGACKLPSGEVIAYEIKERNADRSLGSAIEISEVFKDIITPQEVLGAAKLSVGALEAVVVNSMVENAKAVGEKLTKKAAQEQMMSTLEAHNLVSQSDKKIRFLKAAKSVASMVQPKQITNEKK